MAEISHYLPGILLAYAAFLVAISSPGPNILAIMGTSMSTDRRKGLALALGVSLGSLCWGALTAAGLSAVLVTYASALTVIKILGGIYLLWLAFKSFKAAAAPHSPQAAPLSDEAMSVGGYFRRGLLIQMSNPKAALAWVAIISLGLPEGAPYWVAIAIVSGTSVLSLAIHSAYALIFSTPVMAGIYTRARRFIQSLLGAFFLFAGVKMLTSRG
jgi:threonine/homoserine/homoserine lactone efflux protein